MIVNILLLIGIAVGIVVVVGLLVFGGLYESEKHPRFGRWLEAYGRTMPGYVPPDADITSDYLSQVPGGWDDRP